MKLMMMELFLLFKIAVVLWNSILISQSEVSAT